MSFFLYRHNVYFLRIWLFLSKFSFFFYSVFNEVLTTTTNIIITPTEPAPTLRKKIQRGNGFTKTYIGIHCHCCWYSVFSVANWETRGSFTERDELGNGCCSGVYLYRATFLNCCHDHLLLLLLLPLSS